MDRPKNYIEFTITLSGEEHRLKTYWREYRDLRDLIVDKLLLDDFGQCGGMGRCATCMVSIEGSANDVSLMRRNEETTLTKIGLSGGNIRLACQIPIDDDISNVHIHIPNEYWR